MKRDSVRDLLQQLLDTIRDEREHAKQLNIQAMLDDVAKKESLLATLNAIPQLDPEDRGLAAQIREENRRNAFLFRATLNWIQETMVFFGKKTAPTTYGKSGHTTSAPVNGRLLSGRI
ncbi:flagellar protein FlgN [Desulfogranum japonicum]|uniref:flagellar protein FlgN n=1 Tax=Desulfogranum japonicum TaxID=231447 RepID=UPI00040B19E9|nr:flagellar protein FlgN [Desulfogranum japonicum]